MDPIDILNEYKADLVKREGFGEKSVENLLGAIENSKNNNLDKLLFGLGIRHVGAKTARIIAENYNDIFEIFNATEEELSRIKDIGDATSKSIVSFFKEDKNKDIIKNLKNMGVNTIYIDNRKKEETVFSRKTVVLTGALDKYSRDEAKAIIEKMGGNVSSSVSKNTDYVLVGDNPGSKYDKAVSLGIQIINESDFDNMIKNG